METALADMSNGLIVRGLFRPSDALREAYLRARAIAHSANKKKTKKKFIPISPVGASTVVAEGDLRAGNLLYQIRYWRGKEKPWIGGRRWIAKSGKEWAAETCLSMSQYQRALKKLKTTELIEAEQHLFGSRNLTHIRPLTYIGLDVAASESGQK